MAAIKAAIFQSLIVFMILFSFNNTRTSAKLLAMRPLSASQVYRLLHESGRADAIPQGRVITQGLAAMTGFAFGLKKGLGGALLFDIITANVTAADLESAVNGGGSNVSENSFTTEEVCFNSRNARSLEEAVAVAEAYSRDSSTKKDKVRLSEVERRIKLKRRDKRRKNSSKKAYRKRPSRLALTKLNVQTSSVTVGTSPTTVDTGTDTNTDNGAGSATISTTTTSTDNEGAINCIVIQKPKKL